jgi:AhpD family alkylhydroperoxidase
MVGVLVQVLERGTVMETLPEKSEMTAHAPSFSGQSSGTGEKQQGRYKLCGEEDALDGTTKELLMLALACAFRCPDCTEEHIKGALEVGASKAEVVEVVLASFAFSGQVHDKH